MGRWKHHPSSARRMRRQRERQTGRAVEQSRVVQCNANTRSLLRHPITPRAGSLHIPEIERVRDMYVWMDVGAMSSRRRSQAATTDSHGYGYGYGYGLRWRARPCPRLCNPANLAEGSSTPCNTHDYAPRDSAQAAGAAKVQRGRVAPTAHMS
ncbi:hypothetical protein BU26DRAFT_162862 [Trematosphaeria pertusa]|uniref:Uncharacterized protein n=1 Tax=Trematosphaeria pertusa TaxID=390896 RepID=A0A6A6HV67_9PLEO|nr:uncharacterized protein BU26DRAFT_162862 [Trematosphaeria pertusa]KAF2241986.1 hypothetical protein BU26DRAFT_162862 [Trematosphaeria pertusa]